MRLDPDGLNTALRFVFGEAHGEMAVGECGDLNGADGRRHQANRPHGGTDSARCAQLSAPVVRRGVMGLPWCDRSGWGARNERRPGTGTRRQHSGLYCIAERMEWCL